MRLAVAELATAVDGETTQPCGWVSITKHLHEAGCPERLGSRSTEAEKRAEHATVEIHDVLVGSSERRRLPSARHSVEHTEGRLHVVAAGLVVSGDLGLVLGYGGTGEHNCHVHAAELALVIGARQPVPQEELEVVVVQRLSGIRGTRVNNQRSCRLGSLHPARIRPWQPLRLQRRGSVARWSQKRCEHVRNNKKTRCQIRDEFPG
eukprot:scaffold34626_cov62-Phaeocystis_antarctica.AAC.3